MQPGEYHDVALPRPSYEGLYGTIYCSRCEFFGLGYNHPEWCTWEWLKETGAAQHSSISLSSERESPENGPSAASPGERCKIKAASKDE